MKIVVGLGNPGSKYAYTRHNVGFWVIDSFAAKMGVKVDKIKFKSLCGETVIDGEKVLLIKPQTYMNLSGQAVMEAVNFYKLDMSNLSNQLIVISDDVALETGRIRIRAKGSDGGHNGLYNIIYLLGSDQFTRLRIGIGQPVIPMIKYVLQALPTEDVPTMKKATEMACDAICDIITKGTEFAMNRYNAKG